MGGAGMAGVWMIWPLLVLIGLVLLGYLGYRLAAGPNQRQPGEEGVGSARQILDERFARGEIDEEDYRRRRARLR
jgi:putative membrane protein